MTDGWVGKIEIAKIVEQVVYTANLQGYTPDDLTTFLPEQWDSLFSAAFGQTYGSVRVAIITGLMRLKDEGQTSTLS